MRKLIAITLGVALALVGTVALASRNSSGTYTVTASGTYPFVTGTTISSTTMTSIFSDLSTEMTDSLSRSGKGGMLAPLRTPDGSVSAPPHSFTNETGTGLYRIGATDVGFALGGTKKFEIASGTGSTFVDPVLCQSNVAISGTLTVAGQIDRPSLPTVGQQVSLSSGTWSQVTSGATWYPVTNLTATLTTTGRPVMIFLQPDGTANAATLQTSGNTLANIRITRDGSSISVVTLGPGPYQPTPSSVVFLDTGASAASHTYVAAVQGNGAGNTVSVSYVSLVVYEL